MKLELIREPSVNGCTLGRLVVDGKFECHTLEDVVRKEKIYGETAIPAGVYEVIINFSNRFKRDLPLLVNVPGFEGIRIHPGNVAADTYGCILPGKTRTTNSVGSSVLAFNALYAKILKAWVRGENIQITIKGA